MNPDPVAGTEETWREAEDRELAQTLSDLAATRRDLPIAVTVAANRIGWLRTAAEVAEDRAAALAAENARLRQQRDAPPVLAPDIRVLLDGDERDWFVANVETLGDGVAHAVLLNAANGPLLRPASPPEWPLSQDPTPVDAPSTTTPEPSETSTEGARGTQEAHVRCMSCEHEARFHQPDGCWYTVETGTPGKDAVCACSVPRPLLEPFGPWVVGDQVIDEAAPAGPSADVPADTDVAKLRADWENARSSWLEQGLRLNAEIDRARAEADVWNRRALAAERLHEDAQQREEALRLELAAMTRDRDETRAAERRLRARLDAAMAEVDRCQADRHAAILRVSAVGHDSIEAVVAQRDEARGVIERFTAGVEALADELGLIPRGYSVLNRLRALLRSTTPETSQP